MKIELCIFKRGDLQLEIISETELEYRLLEKAWEIQGYKRGDGKSIAPTGGSSGFYIPLCTLMAKWHPDQEDAP